MTKSNLIEAREEARAKNSDLKIGTARFNELMKEILNNAIETAIAELGLDISPEAEYDHGIEYDYLELLEDFTGHIELLSSFRGDDNG